jgi:hypothetical protein
VSRLTRGRRSYCLTYTSAVVRKLSFFFYFLLAFSFLSLVPKPANELLVGTWVPMKEGSHLPDETAGKMVFTLTTCTFYDGRKPEVRFYSLTAKAFQHKARRAVKGRSRYLHLFDADGDTTASHELIRLDTSRLALRPVEDTDTLQFIRVR